MGRLRIADFPYRSLAHLGQLSEQSSTLEQHSVLCRTRRPPSPNQGFGRGVCSNWVILRVDVIRPHMESILVPLFPFPLSLPASNIIARLSLEIGVHFHGRGLVIGLHGILFVEVRGICGDTGQRGHALGGIGDDVRLP